ncbi:phage major capsid protein [Pseudonocardia sp. RS010]|uniref:phage major capsid protein n=1 Tax=Pseudonocardia sp. RS010 TaxID=3385979 RepID=UPI00399F2E8A
MLKTTEELIAELQAILDGAEERDLTDDEVANYEAIEAQIESRRKREEIEKRNAAYKAVRTPALQTGAKPKDDETLERAFNHYLRTGKEDADLVELRAQSEGTGSEGGYLVPDGFRNKLVDRMKAFGGIANVVEEFTTSTGNSIEWPTVDDTSNTGEIVAEGGTFSSGADLVVGTANLGAYKYMAGGGSSTPLRVSVELLQDAAFDIERLVSNKLGERIARIQASHLVTGTGVSQPQGIVTGIVGQEMSSDGPVYNDLVDFIHAVDPAYRDSGNCRWAFNDASLATLKKMVDSNGDPIWRPTDANMATDLGGGVLMGYPVTIDQAFGDIVGSNGADDNWGVFGDLREGYVVRRVKEITLVVNPWTRAAYGQVEFTAWARMDAAQQNTNAYVALAGYTA